MSGRPLARWAGWVAAATLLLGTAACTSDPNSVAEQAKAGDQKGYVSGDGAVETIPAADRAEPVTATHLLSRCDFFFQCHFVCFLSGIRMLAALSWCRRYKRRVE